jgi:hypothetical protein
MTVPRINGLILIDCWENNQISADSNKNTKKYVLPRQKFFTELVHNLKRFKFAGIINASTNLTSNPNVLGQKTSVIVQEYLNQYKTVANITTQSRFFKLRESDRWKNINHWLVVGAAWRVCCHLNDMGLCSFTTMSRQHKELNFYGAPWGFLKFNIQPTLVEDFEADLLTWVPQGELFKLEPEYVYVNNILSKSYDRAYSQTETLNIRNKYLNETPY